jgi:hypothetical protein
MSDQTEGTSPPSFTRSDAEGRQGFVPQTAAEVVRLRKQNVAELDADARRKRENWGFYSLLAVMILSFAVSLGLAVLSSDAEIQTFAQGAFTTILGGVLGGVAGYVTGSKTGS